MLTIVLIISIFVGHHFTILMKAYRAYDAAGKTMIHVRLIDKMARYRMTLQKSVVSLADDISIHNNH